MAGEDRKTIDDIIRTLTYLTITGNERIVGRDGAGDFKALLSDVKTWMSAFFPAGTPSRIIPGQLTLSYTNTTTFGITAGSVLDDTFIYALSLLTAWTKTTAAWAVGTGNGGALDALAANQTRYVFLIRKDSDGSIDVAHDSDSGCANIPVGYTAKRHIGRLRLNAASEIIDFYQIGNMFRFRAQINDRASNVIPNTSRNLLTVSAPENCIGIFSCMWVTASSAAAFGIVQATGETDIAASATNFTGYSYLANGAVNPEQLIYIDSSRQIAYRGTTTNLYLRIGCLGWIDPLI